MLKCCDFRVWGSGLEFPRKKYCHSKINVYTLILCKFNTRDLHGQSTHFSTDEYRATLSGKWWPWTGHWISVMRSETTYKSYRSSSALSISISSSWRITGAGCGFSGSQRQRPCREGRERTGAGVCSCHRGVEGTALWTWLLGCWCFISWRRPWPS